MLCRALAFCVMTSLFSTSVSRSEALFPFGRLDGLVRGELEIGSFVIRQNGLSGGTETGYYAPLKWTGFHSDTLDWKFEAALGYFSKRAEDWRSFIVAPGFRYRIDDATTMTPFVRLGFARMKSESEARFAFGADILFQRTFTLDPQAARGTHRFVVAEAQVGFMAYEGNDEFASARHAFLIAKAAYDWPVAIESRSEYGINRAKLGLGFEGQFGQGRSTDALLLLEASLRSENPDTGRLRHKIDLSGGIGGNGQYRLSLGYTRGF